jgi:hypothetical protein
VLSTSTLDSLNAQLIMAGDGKALKRAVNYVMSHAGTLALIPALGYVAVSAFWAAFRLVRTHCIVPRRHGLKQAAQTVIT